MPDINNIGKYLIDRKTGYGCYIAGITEEVYYCSDWVTIENIFIATLTGLEDSGYGVMVRHADIVNNPDRYDIRSGPYVPPEDPSLNFLNRKFTADGTQDTFDVEEVFTLTSLQVWEDGILLDSQNVDEIEKVSPTEFKIKPAPLAGSVIIMRGQKV
jgi:hypothetical protein